MYKKYLENKPELCDLLALNVVRLGYAGVCFGSLHHYCFLIDFTTEYTRRTVPTNQYESSSFEKILKQIHKSNL
jgi:hypothetical protein